MPCALWIRRNSGICVDVEWWNDLIFWESFRFQKLNSSLGPPTHPTTPNQQKTNQNPSWIARVARPSKSTSDESHGVWHQLLGIFMRITGKQLASKSWSKGSMCDFHQCKGSSSSLPKPIQGVQSPFLVAKHLETRSSTASWWLQPIWEIFVKHGVILKIHSGWTFQKTFETTSLHFWQRICWKLENGQVGRFWFTCFGNLFPRHNECSIGSFSFLATKQGSWVIPTQTTKEQVFASSFIPPDMGFALGACCLLWFFSHFTSSLVFFLHRKRNGCPLKFREHFKREVVLQPLSFRGRGWFWGECISKHILPPSCNRRSSRQASSLLGRTVVRRAGYISCTWTAVMMKGMGPTIAIDGMKFGP